MLQISSRNCHVGYTIWAGSFQILFWIGYYLCFSWRLAIVNTHRYLLKSDDFLTSLYNDRSINLPDTLEDAKDADDQEQSKSKKSSPENQRKSDKKGTSQKKWFTVTVHDCKLLWNIENNNAYMWTFSYWKDRLWNIETQSNRNMYEFNLLSSFH